MFSSFERLHDTDTNSVTLTSTINEFVKNVNLSMEPISPFMVNRTADSWSFMNECVHNGILLFLRYGSIQFHGLFENMSLFTHAQLIFEISMYHSEANITVY